jgi:hypothetical protein
MIKSKNNNLFHKYNKFLRNNNKIIRLIYKKFSKMSLISIEFHKRRNYKKKK